MRERDGIIYKNVKCSDGYFEPAYLDTIKRKEQGILQFSKINGKRGDEEERMAKLKEYAKP